MNKPIFRGGEFYETPDVELLDVKFDSGFAVSDTSNMPGADYGDNDLGGL